MPLGSLDASAGPHRVVLRYAGADAAPGSAGDEFALGPPFLSLRTALPRLRSHMAVRADALCRQELDWIEAVRPAR
jgi:hypothetical protein